jgi:uncharacterized membrane protein
MMEEPDRILEVFDLERVVFFSDAVFAIAITLLAVDLRLPPGDYTNQSLIDAILAMGAQIQAFVLSFAVIALFWIGHFRTFRIAARINARLIFLNLILLGLVAFLPFPTSVLATDGALPAAVFFYGAYVLVTSVVSALLIVYVVNAGLARPEIYPDVGRRIAIRAFTVPVFFAVSLPVALISPFAAQVLWVVSIPAQVIITRRLRLVDPLQPGAA